ncbi:MAG: hypothetical protein ABR573_08610 [Candidatus Dormibacteria bacterium]
MSWRAVLTIGMALALSACGNTASRGVTHAASASPRPSPTPSASASADGGANVTPGLKGAGGPSQPGAAVAPGAGIKRSTSAAPAPRGFPNMSVPAEGSYSVNINSADYTGPGTISISARPAAQPGDHTIRRETKTPKGSEAETLSWRADGVYMLQTTLSSPSTGAVDCNWQPEILDFVIPAGKGQQWSSSSTCPVSFGATTGSVEETSDETITDASTLTIGADTVQVWVVKVHLVLTYKAAAGSFTSTTDGTAWVAPAIGMIVKQTGSTTTGGSTAPPRSTSMEMTSIHPS